MKFTIKSLFWGLFLMTLTMFAQSPQPAYLHDDEQALIDKIKIEIVQYEKIRREILAKYPKLNVYRLKAHFYGRLGDYFRANKEYNDFFQSLNQTQKNNFKKYFALQKKKHTANIVNSDEYHSLRKLLKLMEQYNPENNMLAKFDRFFNLERHEKTTFSDTEQQQLDELEGKLSNLDLLNSILLSSNYDLGFNFYESSLRCIVEKPLKEQRKKIFQLINEFYKLKDNKLDNEEKLFVRNSYRIFKDEDVLKRIPLERYYRIEALLACLKNPRLRESVKLRLKDNYALRKALLSLLSEKTYAMPADRHAWRDKRAKKTRGSLNYDNFDKYWANLEKVCEKLLKDVFIKENKRSDYSLEQVKLSHIAGCVFIECLFNIDSQGVLEVSGVFPPAHMKGIAAKQAKPNPAMQELNRLKQFALACHMFAHDNNGNLPGSIEQLKPYLGKLDISNIILVEKSKKLRDLKHSSSIIMAVSTRPLKDGRYAAAFIDGHCKLITQEELPNEWAGNKK
jgi:hypothetical protein